MQSVILSLSIEHVRVHILDNDNEFVSGAGDTVASEDQNSDGKEDCDASFGRDVGHGDGGVDPCYDLQRIKEKWEPSGVRFLP